jgi:hypothetical protein
MENSGAATAIALILVMSFAVDRIVAGLLFLLFFSSTWRRMFPEPSSISEDGPRSKAERDNKVIYFVLAGALCIAILAGFPNVRIVSALGLSRGADETSNTAAASSKAATGSTPSSTPSPPTGAAPRGSPDLSASASASPTSSRTPTVGSGLSSTPSQPFGESILDFIVTGLILMGGAERIAALIKLPGAPGGERLGDHPIQITGKLTLEEPGGKKEAKL